MERGEAALLLAVRRVGQDVKDASSLVRHVKSALGLAFQPSACRLGLGDQGNVDVWLVQEIRGYAIAWHPGRAAGQNDHGGARSVRRDRVGYLAQSVAGVVALDVLKAVGDPTAIVKPGRPRWVAQQCGV